MNATPACTSWACRWRCADGLLAERDRDRRLALVAACPRRCGTPPGFASRSARCRSIRMSIPGTGRPGTGRSGSRTARGPWRTGSSCRAPPARHRRSSRSGAPPFHRRRRARAPSRRPRPRPGCRPRPRTSSNAHATARDRRCCGIGSHETPSACASTRNSEMPSARRSPLVRTGTRKRSADARELHEQLGARRSRSRHRCRDASTRDRSGASAPSASRTAEDDEQHHRLAIAGSNDAAAARRSRTTGSCRRRPRRCRGAGSARGSGPSPRRWGYRSRKRPPPPPYVLRDRDAEPAELGHLPPVLGRVADVAGFDRRGRTRTGTAAGRTRWPTAGAAAGRRRS